MSASSLTGLVFDGERIVELEQPAMVLARHMSAEEFGAWLRDYDLAASGETFRMVDRGYRQFCRRHGMPVETFQSHMDAGVAEAACHASSQD